MDAIHLHLILNHIPLTGVLFAVVFLGAGLFLKSETLQKTGLWVGFVMAVLAAPVYLTGEQAEDGAERLPGISESLIENHEELAVLAVTLFGVMGAFSLLSILAFSFKKPLFPFLTKITLVAACIAFLAIAAAANSGGKIRHPEIRPDFQMPAELQPADDH